MKKTKVKNSFECILKFSFRILLLLIFPVLLQGQSIEKETIKLKGKFAGEWTSYKRNVAGEIEIASTWKDTVTAGEPIISDKMVYVNVHTDYTFDNLQLDPFSLDFKEGFYVDNNKVKDRFFSTGGEIIKMIQLDKNTFAYSQKMHQNEFTQMRFFTGIEGFHTIIKVESMEKRQEIHRITRLTTIQYYNEKEEIVTTQFVSLKGYHKRIAP
jgi:hypothetical protein